MEALTKARREAMLPRIDVDAMSLADINQLTVEAERVAEMHEELRATTAAKIGAPKRDVVDAGRSDGHRRVREKRRVKIVL